MISLYFHIPFCTKKCPYCHFYVIPNRPLYHQILREALYKEWEQKLPLLQNQTIASIYFGGGTPSLFASADLEAILTRIRSSCFLDPHCEITIEANPEDASFELFQLLQALGINRLSLGVQSLDDRSLNTLERTHSATKAREAIHLAHAAGFSNISIDLMYDLPDQTEASWQYTLDKLPNLPIRHLSLYNLTIEPHTPFFKRKLSLPAPSLSLRLLERALASIPLPRYEISAFAHPSFESKHNLGYWTARPFLGFGPSAFSFWEGSRFRNIANLHRYARALKEDRSPVDFSETLPYPKNLREQLAIHLRVLEGAPKQIFPEELSLTLERLQQNGFLKIADKICLTEKGLLFYDTIAAEIV